MDNLRRWQVWAALAVFLVVSLRYIELPGLYMDSVTPDYIASWLLAKQGEQPAWIYPDNILAGPYRLPLLNSLYGGNVVAYIGLVFFQCFGFSISSVRLFHVFLGGGLIVAFVFALMQLRVRRWVALVFGVTLACDPTYVLAWRTQYYLQLFPLFFFFLSIALLCREADKAVKGKAIFISGLLLGLAAWSYFIFAIYAAVVICWFRFSDADVRSRNMTKFLALGFAVGVCPYIYAHLSIIIHQGWEGYLSTLRGLQTAYGVVDRDQGLMARIAHVANRLYGLLGGRDIETQVFGSGEVAMCLPALGFLLVFGWAVAVGIWMWMARRRWSGIAGLLGVIFLTHLAFGLIVGKPLGLQHYIMLIPLSLFFTALVVSEALEFWLGNKLAVRSCQFAALLICGCSAYAGNLIMSRVGRDESRGFYSSAINSAIAYARAEGRDSLLVFPQWGYWMGFVTALGPKYSVFQSTGLDEIVESEEFLNRARQWGRVIIVLGDDKFSAVSAAERRKLLGRLVDRLGMVVAEEVDFRDRDSESRLRLTVLRNKRMLFPSIVNWGPQDAKKGIVPNEQVNGRAGVWVKFSSELPFDDICVLVGEAEQCDQTVVDKAAGLVSFSLKAENFAQSGGVTLELVSKATRSRVFVGSLQVR